MPLYTLDELNEHLENKLMLVNQTLLLCSAIGDEDYNGKLSDLEHQIDSIRSELNEFRNHIQQGKQQLQSLQELKSQSERIKEHLQYTLSNIPAMLPKQKTVAHSARSDADVAEPAKQTPIVDTAPDYVDFLTVEEFDSVPKYMKGRLTYDKVNSVIEKLNEVYTEKYNILKQKKSSLNDMNRKRCEEFKQQENKDTKGFRFIVERDITEFSSLKVDNTMRNMITILRHCGRLSEIRGKGYIRYANSRR